MHAVVDKGENVFITGSAGTGKSFLVAHLLEMLVAKYGASAVAATAPTAVAARLLPGGMTLASFAGYGLLREENDVDLTRVVTNILACPPAQKRWESTKALVIDGISMVIDGEYGRVGARARGCVAGATQSAGLLAFLCVAARACVGVRAAGTVADAVLIFVACVDDLRCHCRVPGLDWFP